MANQGGSRLQAVVLGGEGVRCVLGTEQVCDRRVKMEDNCSAIGRTLSGSTYMPRVILWLAFPTMKGISSTGWAGRGNTSF